MLTFLVRHLMSGRGAISLSFYLPLWHTICLYPVIDSLSMTDIDFIRLSALVFATKLIGRTDDPVSEGLEMAERLFNNLKQKEVE